MKVLYIILVCWAVQAQAQQAVLKDGACPSGYATSGKYCTPMKNAKSIIEKQGACPIGYTRDQQYCKAVTRIEAIFKTGACPSGYRKSNEYCIR